MTAQYNHRRPLESFLAADDEENGRISPESDQNFITVNGGEEVDTCSASDADFFQNVGQLNHSPTSPFEKYPQSMPKSASTSVLFDSVRISAASSTPPPKPPYRTKHGHKGPPPPPPPRIDSLLRQLPVVPNPRHNGHNGHNGHAKTNAVTFQTEHVRVAIALPLAT